MEAINPEAIGVAAEANIVGGAGMLQAGGEDVVEGTERGVQEDLTPIVVYAQLVLAAQGIGKHSGKLKRMGNLILRIWEYMQRHSGVTITAAHLAHLDDYNWLVHHLRKSVGKWSDREITFLVLAVIILDSKKGAFRLVHLILPHRSIYGIKSKVDMVFANHGIHPPH